MDKINEPGNQLNGRLPFVNRLLWLAAFSIAMGFLEATVVIYLRKIYYPEGFGFPLTIIEPDIALVEFLREAATLVMLVSIGVLAGRNATERFLYFIYCFGVWDIVYYVVLKLFLDWPLSILEWDILFLIPIPWVGPVLAPCIVSATMIFITIMLMKENRKLSRKSIIYMVAGSLLIISSFCLDYVGIIYNSSKVWVPGSQQQLFADINNFIPTYYNWYLFAAGEIVILLAVFYKRKRIT